MSLQVDRLVGRAAQVRPREGHPEKKCPDFETTPSGCIEVPSAYKLASHFFGATIAATHFMLTMRHLGKLPAGQRHPSEVLVDKLARTASSVPDEPRTIWSVGKRLENRDGLEARRTSWLSAEWADGESVLVHEYSLQPPSAVKDEMSFAGF
eukprot:TRINITY_DN31351_c0_g1_i2.p1 TRINITY_DN31351_c0_g1~~TRINITY_DN31351_c0_g1_i2.p1  ORF type:complete len:152 (-),score=4.81 TRINITY_DN31351_c0_g1_i2:449-904(-)